MKTIRKVLDSAAIKGIDPEKRTIRAYASTNDWDRYGERFEPDAFKEGLENYRKNPVVLWAHNYSKPPIGKAVAFEFDAKGLILEMQFADTVEAKEVFALYEGGFMSAFSVGFRPMEVAFEKRGDSEEMGAVFKKAELLENSAVPVPANPGALVMKGLGDKTLEFTGDLIRDLWTPSYTPMRPEDAKAADLKPKNSVIVEVQIGDSLKSLIEMGRALKGKKVDDEAVRSLLIQANNVCRELVYGPGSPSLEADGDADDAQFIALVKEYEALSEMIQANPKATDEDRQELEKIGKLIELSISGK